MRLAVVLCVLLGAALPGTAGAATVDRIAIEPGEYVSFELVEEPEAGLVLLERGPAEMSEFDRATAELMGSGAMDHAVGATAGAITAEQLPAPPQIRADRIRVSAALVDGDSVLLFRNGYDRALVYRARIEIEGQVAPTDVCIVLPGLPGVEHWPYPIDRFEISEARLVSWERGDPVTCE